MDRLLPLPAGFDRPAPGRDPKVQVRGKVRGAGSTAHRVRPLQGSAQMADGDAYPRPADPGRALEPDRIPGRHGVRVGGAAAQPAHARPLRLRSAGADARDDRGNAPWLADVVPVVQSFRRRGKARGGEAARAPGRRGGAPDRARQGEAQRAQPRPVPPGDHQAGGAAEHVHSGPRPLAADAGHEVQSEDRRARASAVLGGRPADRRSREIRGVLEDRPPPAGALPDGARHREGAELDRGKEGGQPAQVSLVIAHRGASGYEYENSRAAFRAARARGADAIELDIQAAADGVLFVHHDEVVSGVHITRSSAAQVRALRLPNGESIPALEDALAVIDPALQVFIEVKSLPPQFDDRLLAVLEGAGGGTRCAVHGFDHRIVKRLGVARPGLVRGVLLASYPLRPLEPLQDTGATVLWQEQSLIDAALVDAL